MLILIKVVLTAIVVLMILCFLLFYLFPLVKVNGCSMLPTFTEGEILICRRVFFKNHLKNNKVYVFIRKSDGDSRPLIKRLHHYSPTYGYWFLGDNKEASFDSRSFGYVSPKDVKAVFLKKVK